MAPHPNFTSTNNPHGRPKGAGLKPLLDAISRWEKKYSRSWWDVVVEKSTKSDVIMGALVRKLVPDSNNLDVNHRQDGEWKIKFEGL